MKGKSLRLCAKGHEALWTSMEVCPFCAALAEVQKLARELAALRLEKGIVKGDKA